MFPSSNKVNLPNYQSIFPEKNKEYSRLEEAQMNRVVKLIHFAMQNYESLDFSHQWETEASCSERSVIQLSFGKREIIFYRCYQKNIAKTESLYQFDLKDKKIVHLQNRGLSGREQEVREALPQPVHVHSKKIGPMIEELDDQEALDLQRAVISRNKTMTGSADEVRASLPQPATVQGKVVGPSLEGNDEELI